MERTDVSSSSIKSIGYDKANNILEIEFTSGSIYAYRNVPEGVYERFMRSESKGFYFSVHIRACFEYVCVFKPEKKPKEESHAESATETVPAKPAKKKKRIS